MYNVPRVATIIVTMIIIITDLIIIVIRIINQVDYMSVNSALS